MSHAAVVGGGVIGSGWAARFLLHGWDVTFFDPAPASAARLDQVLDTARRSLSALYDGALPEPGSLRIARSLTGAVAGAHWVQESVPQTLDLKRSVLSDIESGASTDAIVASSTSGFRPSILTEQMANPERFCVCHPFNPVYLLPLVEVVPGADTAPDTVNRVQSALAELAMKPLVVRREIDAHIADRLLEAVWRETLWLVQDGVATTEEIDTAITYGFGPRWAQMGLFETYRIAGGDAGMAHFLAQFGPALAWPWSRLSDVPELDKALIDTITAQSDAQSGARSIAELETIRDENLVGILRSLRANHWGAGELVNRWLQRH